MRTTILIATLLIPFGLILIFASAGDDVAHQDLAILEDEQLAAELHSFIRVRNMILERYVEEVDPQDLIYSAIQGMFTPLQHARFYIPEEETRFQEEISGNYIGLGLFCETKDSRLLVKNTLYDSPAGDQLKRGDEILKIDGKAVEGMPLGQAYDLMRGSGEAGTSCDLTVRRKADGTKENCRLVRRRVSRPSVSCGWTVDSEEQIGYIAIERFLKHTHREFDNALNTLSENKIRALILDVRFNTGGVLDAAVAIANLFIPNGVLVSTKGRYAAAERVYTAKRALFKYPEMELVVLINEESASAAEVLAGTLQDYKRAVIVGEHSFGKGVVQSAVTLELMDKPVTIKLPIALYFLPSGRCIEKKLGVKHAGQGGLEPDITMPVTKKRFKALKRRHGNISLQTGSQNAEAETEKELETSDPQLYAAIRLLQGENVVTPMPDRAENK